MSAKAINRRVRNSFLANLGRMLDQHERTAEERGVALQSYDEDFAEFQRRNAAAKINSFGQLKDFVDGLPAKADLGKSESRNFQAAKSR